MTVIVTRTHTVAKGQTLSSIAAKYGVSVAAIADANGIENPNMIRTGQRLTIPAKLVTKTYPMTPPIVAGAGTAPAPATGGTEAKAGTLLTDLIKTGTNAYIDIRNADANRRLAIAQGQPISSIPAADVAGVQTQSAGMGESAKWLLVALVAVVAGAALTSSKP